MNRFVFNSFAPLDEEGGRPRLLAKEAQDLAEGDPGR
jgi:hypothetical protein